MDKRELINTVIAEHFDDIQSEIKNRTAAVSQDCISKGVYNTTVCTGKLLAVYYDVFNCRVDRILSFVGEKALPFDWNYLETQLHERTEQIYSKAEAAACQQLVNASLVNQIPSCRENVKRKKEETLEHLKRRLKLLEMTIGNTETRYDKIVYNLKNNKFITSIKNHPILAPILVFAIFVLPLLMGFWEKLKPVMDLFGKNNVIKSEDGTKDKYRTDSIYDSISREPNMPQRSNEFQSLIAKIQRALHGKNAKVQESAMIYNYDTDSQTEVDVLVTFQVGSTEYRTAIECQDRSRPAGVPWIAELKSKRDGCRLDKIIAVHSDGFTQSAETLAKKYGIETLTPRKIEGDILSDIIPFKYLVGQTCVCNFPNGIIFDMVGPNPIKIEESSCILIFSENTQIGMIDFQNQIKEILRKIFLKKYSLEGTKVEIQEREISEEMEVEIKFPRGAMLRPTLGEDLHVRKASGYANVQIKTKKMDFVENISLKEGVIATLANFEMMGKKASITLSQQKETPDKMGICVYWEGGQVSEPIVFDKRLAGNVEIYCKLKK